MPSIPWLPRVRHHLGVLPDAEVARRAGVHVVTIVRARQDLGIVAARRRDLDAVGLEETLRLVRARSREGKPMRQSLVHSAHLLALCRRHFGGWYQAVEAAGLKPEGRARSTQTPPVPRKRPLTEALLRGPKSAAELELLTGFTSRAIRARRKVIGIVRDERARAALGGAAGDPG